jgi:Zn-dependent M16 (insulinase) family peptidase
MDDTEKISIILRQTDYTEEDAKKYLELYDGDCSKVIRYYLVGDKATATAIVKPDKIPAKNLNQEIYKQFRQKLEIVEDKKRG